MLPLFIPVRSGFFYPFLCFLSTCRGNSSVTILGPRLQSGWLGLSPAVLREFSPYLEPSRGRVSESPLKFFYTPSALFPRNWSLFLPFWSTNSTIISSCHPPGLAFLFKINTTYTYVYAAAELIMPSHPHSSALLTLLL